MLLLRGHLLPGLLIIWAPIAFARGAPVVLTAIKVCSETNNWMADGVLTTTVERNC